MFTVKLFDTRKNSQHLNNFILYKPLLKKFEKLKLRKYKFKLKSNMEGTHLLTGGYNNIFHILDLKTLFNIQIVINETELNSSNQSIAMK